jgi:HAD superfamily hydrolase (TIGR01490 family)
MSVVFFDIDKTIIRPQTIFLIARHFWRQKWIRWTDLTSIFLLVLVYQLRRLMRLPVSERILRRLTRFVANRDVSDFEKEISMLFRQDAQQRILSQAREEIERHQANGHLLVIISATIESLANHLGQELGADQVIATKLETEGKRLTGRLENIVFGAEKLNQAKKISSDLSKDYFYTDCLSDLPLLRAVGFPRVVNPDRRLEKIAKKEKWPIFYWRN